MKRSSSHAAVLAAVVLGVGGVAGCGSDTPDSSSSSSSSTSSSSTTTEAKLPTATELFDQARSTALAAESAHIVGSVSNDGKPMTVDLSGATDGSNQSLELGVGGGAKATILTVGGKYYLLGNAKFWSDQISANAAKLLDGKYVKVPAAEAKDFGDLTIKSLLTELFDDKEMQAALKSPDSKVAKTTVDGGAAYSVTDKTGKKGGELIVSADGKATIFKIVGPSDDTGELEFSEWNKVAKVDAPPASQIIDVLK
jgi:outer membrane murein-binding lipoprotein Lpp